MLGLNRSTRGVDHIWASGSETQHQPAQRQGAHCRQGLYVGMLLNGNNVAPLLDE
jgi:hypothetical protein